MAEYTESDDVLICRCEGVSLARIKQSIADGCRSPQEVKGYTRVGMGICQGRTCGSLLVELVAAMTDNHGATVAPMSSRPPVRPVSLKDLAEGYGDGGTGDGS